MLLRILFLVLALITYRAPTFASAYYQFNYKEKTLDIYAFLHFYTLDGIAIDEQAKDIVEKITAQWNENPVEIKSGTHAYQTRFIVGYDFGKSALGSRSTCEENLVQITNQSIDTSFVEVVGGQEAIIKMGDLLKSNTTASHEFGHLLGLNHGNEYEMDANPPGIMFARGTHVQKQFQYTSSPNQKETDRLDPNFRKVRQNDIWHVLMINHVLFGNGCIGDQKLKMPDLEKIRSSFN
jgi:hypothetical protein